MDKKHRYKVLIITILLIVLFTATTYAAILYSANIVYYNNSNGSLTSNNVQGAIDELATRYANIECPSGKYCIDKFPSYMPDNVPDSYGAVMDNVKSEYVTGSTGITFSSISSGTNGKGLYIFSPTAYDTHPIYYYRGAVDNNNVLFGDFCWKIVRTTDTGGIKLIYNGAPTDGKCMNTTGDATQLSGTTKFNNSYNSPAEVGYMYGNSYAYSRKTSSSLATSYKYGNSFTYSGGTYTLKDTIDSSGTWSSDYKALNNNHYTCFNTTGKCNSLYYIYYTSTSYAYYITLTNGKSVENALDEMLTSSSNTTNSTIKGVLDTWYQNNLSSYSTYLEDTVWCNDRSIASLNGWNPNGGDMTKYLYFGAYERVKTTYSPMVTCPSVNDSFTVSNSNGNGKLTYPVGLLTADEIMMAGGKTSTKNNSYYLYTNKYFWAGSPYYFYVNYSHEFDVKATGALDSAGVTGAYGARPAVSLKPGTKFTTGDGTAESPFKINSN